MSTSLEETARILRELRQVGTVNLYEDLVQRLNGIIASHNTLKQYKTSLGVTHPSVLKYRDADIRVLAQQFKIAEVFLPFINDACRGSGSASDTPLFRNGEEIFGAVAALEKQTVGYNAVKEDYAKELAILKVAEKSVKSPAGA